MARAIRKAALGNRRKRNLWGLRQSVGARQASCGAAVYALWTVGADPHTSATQLAIDTLALLVEGRTARGERGPWILGNRGVSGAVATTAGICTITVVAARVCGLSAVEGVLCRSQ